MLIMGLIRIPTKQEWDAAKIIVEVISSVLSVMHSFSRHTYFLSIHHIIISPDSERRRIIANK